MDMNNYIEPGSKCICPKCQTEEAEVLGLYPMILFCPVCASLEFGEDWDTTDFERANDPNFKEDTTEEFTKDLLARINAIFDTDELDDNEILDEPTEEESVFVDWSESKDQQDIEPDETISDDSTPQAEKCEVPFNMKVKKSWKEDVKTFAAREGVSMASVITTIVSKYIQWKREKGNK